MIRICRAILAMTGVVFAADPLLANSKSLLVNGVNAALYGDFSVDKGRWQNQDSFSALRMKVGVQLIRLGFTAVTIGYQKVGFYTAEKNWDALAGNKTHFDYRGPLVELHLFPDETLNISFSGFEGSGYSFYQDKKGGVNAFQIDCQSSPSCLAIDTERSTLAVQEYAGQLNFKLKSSLQIFLGGGFRQVEGARFYEEIVSEAGNSKLQSTEFRSYGVADWKSDSKFFMLGIRGSTL